MDQAAGYGVFANGGYRMDPYGITEIRNLAGDRYSTATISTRRSASASSRRIRWPKSTKCCTRSTLPAPVAALSSTASRRPARPGPAKPIAMRGISATPATTSPRSGWAMTISAHPPAHRRAAAGNGLAAVHDLCPSGRRPEADSRVSAACRRSRRRSPQASDARRQPAARARSRLSPRSASLLRTLARLMREAAPVTVSEPPVGPVSSVLFRGRPIDSYAAGPDEATPTRYTAARSTVATE
jgi:hypothetical protein